MIFQVDGKDSIITNTFVSVKNGIENYAQQ